MFFSNTCAKLDCPADPSLSQQPHGQSVDLLGSELQRCGAPGASQAFAARVGAQAMGTPKCGHTSAEYSAKQALCPHLGMTSFPGAQTWPTFQEYRDPGHLFSKGLHRVNPSNPSKTAPTEAASCLFSDFGRRLASRVVYVDPERPLVCGIGLAEPQNIWGVSFPPDDWYESRKKL